MLSNPSMTEMLAKLVSYGLADRMDHAASRDKLLQNDLTRCNLAATLDDVYAAEGICDENREVGDLLCTKRLRIACYLACIFDFLITRCHD